MHIRSFENRAFIVVVALVTVAFAWVVRDFLLPVFWAVVLAVLFTPLFQKVRRLFRGRAAAASLVTLLIVLVAVVAPLVGIGAAVTGEAVGVYARVSSGDIDLTEPIHTVEAWMPELARRAEEMGVDLDKVRESVEATALNVSQTVASGLLSAGQQALQFTVLLAVTLYVLFFFLRDGDLLVARLIRALPLGDPREKRLFTKFAAVTRATVKGTFVVSAVQGAIGGIAFALLGLGSPLLWGVLMGIFSLLPAVGGALVWIPAAAYLIVTGAWVKGLILIGIGAGIMGTVDNALRPILVGRDAGMPDYLILVSTLGGLAALGISGIVIGPVVAGLFLTVWDIFAEEFGPDDDAVPSDLAVADGTNGVPSETPPVNVVVETEPDPDHPGEQQVDAVELPAPE